MLGLGSGSASTEVMNSVRQGLSCSTSTVGSSDRVLSKARKQRVTARTSVLSHNSKVFA